MKVHAAAYLASRTFCGRALEWIRENEGEPRRPTQMGKPISVTRRVGELTCNSCLRCSE